MEKIIDWSDPKLESPSASPRLFGNPVLDKLSRTHHLFPLVVYAPVAAIALWLGLSRMPWPVITGVTIAGYLIWTIVEYLGHRFLFHLKAPRAWAKQLTFLMHGVHHDYPSDPLRLVMPPLMSAPILAIAFLSMRLVFGLSFALPLFAGFVIGYIGYDMVHFHVHHRRPKTWLGRMLRQRHMFHHFQDDTSWFGVSAPWWDSVFGTLPRALRTTSR